MRNGIIHRRIAATILLCLIAVVMATVTLTPASAAGKLQTSTTPEGVEACQACHGINGISGSPNIPNLAGQKSGYLAAQLKAFKSKDRKSELMSAIADQLSDADMLSLAKYWGSRPAAPVEGQGPPTAGSAIRSRMTFPASFPKGFTLYETVTEDGTMTKRYANDVAMQAARAGKQLPDGSVIVNVNYDTKKDASGAVVAGAVKSYAGMESRAGWGASIPLLLRNDNWDYALFNGEQMRNDALNAVQCLACHKPKAADSYMFTMKALREIAIKPPG